MTRILTIVLVTLAVVMGVVCVAALVFGAITYDRLYVKDRATHASTVPSPTATTPQPEEQTEEHTCGYHSMRSIYAAYGLSPDEENLRIRLGVDLGAVPGSSQTAGALQPDVFRVLAEDSFQFDPVDLSQPEAAKRLLTHLEAKQLAMALIRRRENGNMHWVVVGPPQGDKLQIVDSLFPAPWFDSPDSFLSQCALSIILISPNGDDSTIPETQTHAAGLEEIRRSHARLKQINENAEQ